MNYAGTIVIRSGREKSLERFHPWVFSGSVERLDGEALEGDLVRIEDSKGKFLGAGHLCSGSISVKVLTFKDELIDEAWVLDRLKRAQHLRTALALPSKQTNAYRLVHGEGDSLPGLIIDIYDKVAVVQPHSAGMEQLLPAINAGLKSLGFKNVVHKGLGGEVAEVLTGKVSERIKVNEHGMKLNVDVLTGQKTGFFLDQRDSRFLLQNFAKDKTVLNVFSYTGGFSIAALMGGAKSAISLDSASKALTIADENAMLNEFSDKHKSLKLDAVRYLEHMEEDYDIIILDPPAFAKHKSARHNAIQAYRRINEQAIKRIRSGGFLFTFSCSQVIDKQLFQDIIASAAINAGRQVRILYHLRQPADHPVSVFHPEGEYLKGLVLAID